MSKKAIQLTDSSGNDILPVSAETGSNSNGSYIKCADGTLIQWGSMSDVGGSTEGQFFLQPNFPIAFNNNNYFSTAHLYDAMRGFSSGNPNLVEARSDFTDKLNIQFTVNRAYDDSNIVYWMAIGRWK